MESNIILAFILTTLAGASTVVGAFLVFWVKTTCTKILSFGLGFSAGVMIYLSFFELLRESNQLLSENISSDYNWLVISMFLAGLGAAGVIDFFTHNKVEISRSFTCKKLIVCKRGKGNYLKKRKILFKTGLFTALAIAIHNFPEGIVTFTTASIDTVFGVSIALAVAIHNIPEGFCIAMPIYFATKSKSKSILYALVAGLAEPIAALLTYLIFFPYINNYILGIMLAIVAGIMVYVAFDELLPTARKFGHNHVGLVGLVFGMTIMAFSLYLLY